MGPIGSPETSVLNHLTLYNNPEEERIQFNPCGSLRSRTTQMFIIAITRYRHLSLSWARSFYSTHSHAMCLWSILILSFYLRFGATSGLSPAGFTVKITSPPICATCLTNLFLMWSPKWYLVRRTEHKAPRCVVFSVRRKYLPQHPILEHPQLVFFPQFVWPGFALIQNKRRNCSSVYLKRYTFKERMWRIQDFWRLLYSERHKLILWRLIFFCIDADFRVAVKE